MPFPPTYLPPTHRPPDSGRARRPLDTENTRRTGNVPRPQPMEMKTLHIHECPAGRGFKERTQLNLERKQAKKVSRIEQQLVALTRLIKNTKWPPCPRQRPERRPTGVIKLEMGDSCRNPITATHRPQPSHERTNPPTSTTKPSYQQIQNGLTDDPR
ncbi:hypothetical protein CROQUDRAFT_110828 [Cronartium quercuum f. sp. fusiforme G11]|uniref:Uncharacterized protein n=1 Tax=Cronartium quercuum f. sp. fusiforme G11 TaxID=708437 RepID=A0A9P6T6J2_9BASI|nr:hypothetical protein CROQUDRAFT_110828 [Cronartium quercuum f. sp. fusiforme G11]